MLNIALFGPPGAGKGTQSKWLVEHFDLVHICPGEILRENIRLKTDLGKTTQSYVETGMLVPDKLVIQAVTHEINVNPLAKGFLFDGYPRTQLQARTLDKQLAAQQRILNMVLFLQVTKEQSYQRIKQRSYELCRKDDRNQRNIDTRFEYYQKTTLPLAEYYKEQRKLFLIPGEENVLTVRAHIHQKVQNHLDRKC